MTRELWLRRSGWRMLRQPWPRRSANRLRPRRRSRRRRRRQRWRWPPRGGRVPAGAVSARRLFSRSQRRVARLVSYSGQHSAARRPCACRQPHSQPAACALAYGPEAGLGAAQAHSVPRAVEGEGKTPRSACIAHLRVPSRTAAGVLARCIAVRQWHAPGRTSWQACSSLPTSRAECLVRGLSRTGTTRWLC